MDILEKRNPDFDDNRVAWDDTYSGVYQPVPYSEQFDGQWKLYLEGRTGFHHHTGVETSAPYIDDRIFELTGVKGILERRNLGPRRRQRVPGPKTEDDGRQIADADDRRGGAEPPKRREEKPRCGHPGWGPCILLWLHDFFFASVPGHSEACPPRKRLFQKSRAAFSHFCRDLSEAEIRTRRPLTTV